MPLLWVIGLFLGLLCLGEAETPHEFLAALAACGFSFYLLHTSIRRAMRRD